MDDCLCPGCFEDFVFGCPEEVRVLAGLEAGISYYFELQDQFGNLYHQPFTADSSGNGLINLEQLAPGFGNPAQGPLKGRVKRDLEGCDYEQLVFGAEIYDCFTIKFRGGDPTKDWIGCTGEQLPILATPEDFAGTVEDGHSVLTWKAVVDATGYIVKQDGAVIFQGAALTFDATGLENGEEYVFSVEAVAPGYRNSPQAVITVTPALPSLTGYLLQRLTNAPPTEAEVLAGTPFTIASHNADYSLPVPNIGPRFIEVFEPVGEQIKTLVNTGGGDSAINSENAFAQIITVGAFRGYITNYMTVIGGTLQLKK